MIRRVEPRAASPRDEGVALRPHRRGAGKMSATQFLRPGWKLGVALSAAGLLAAACGGSSSGGNAAVGTSPTATSTQAAANGNGEAALTITTHKGPAGTYLTTSAGMSLYVFAKDTTNTSNCDASCTVYCPPLSGSSAQTSGAANSAMTATTKRSDGTTQITYGGHPLYTYVGDKKAGDTTGQGQDLNGGKWYLVGTDGKALTGSTSGSGSTGSGWS